MVCLSEFGSDNSQNAMKIAGTLGMTTGDYVYLIPWVIQSGSVLDPWISTDAAHVNAKEEFRSVLTVRTKKT